MLHFRPCSGLVVSGYSKGLFRDESWTTYLAQTIDQYKKFKQMFIVDKNITDFEGLQRKIANLNRGIIRKHEN